jgi:hypothetical protein
VTTVESHRKLDAFETRHLNLIFEIEIHFQYHMNRRRALLHWIRRLHLYLGLGAALYFMLIAATGVALNHREGLRLEDRYLSRQWLPSSYRPQDGIEVRSDIVIGDLHSGLIFGLVGAPIMDVVATVWFLSLLSGLSLAILGRSIHREKKKAMASLTVTPIRDQDDEQKPLPRSIPR